MLSKTDDPARILFVMSEAVLAMDLGEMIARSNPPAIGETARSLDDAERRLSEGRLAALFYDVGALRHRGMADFMRKAAGVVPLVCVGGGVLPRGLDVPAHMTLDLPFHEGNVRALSSRLLNH